MIYRSFIVFLLVTTMLTTSSGAKPRASIALQRAVMAKFPASFETLSGVEFARYLAYKASSGVLAESVGKVFTSISGSAAKAMSYELGFEALQELNRSIGKEAPIAKAYQQLVKSEQEALGKDALEARLIDDETIGEFYQSLVKVLQEYGYDVPEKSYQELISKITSQ